MTATANDDDHGDDDHDDLDCLLSPLWFFGCACLELLVFGLSALAIVMSKALSSSSAATLTGIMEFVCFIGVGKTGRFLSRHDHARTKTTNCFNLLSVWTGPTPSSEAFCSPQPLKPP